MSLLHCHRKSSSGIKQFILLYISHSLIFSGFHIVFYKKIYYKRVKQIRLNIFLGTKMQCFKKQQEKNSVIEVIKEKAGRKKLETILFIK